MTQHQTAATAVPAARLRNEWKQVLLRTANDDEHQVIARYRNPVAVIVPAYWHALALRAMGDVEVETVPSDSARRHYTELLTQAKEHGRHFLITADGYEVAALVPAPWHTAALDALRPNEESPASE